MMEAPHENNASRLSKSAEDYLEAIGTLCNKHGHAQVSDIALLLSVKKPSVTAALRQLSAEGLVEYQQYKPVQLTEAGKQYARRVLNAHGTLRRFMCEVAGLTPERADEAACHMEHILSYEEIASIAQKLAPET